jgi:Protein of unknown function (DUF1559)
MASTRGVWRTGWAAVCVAAGVLAAGPAESADKSDAAHKASENSLKQLAIAFHEYADQHRGEMPPAAVVGPDGKPLYSWRVLLLPYLGEKKLFDEFKPGEAWDGPNNKKLLAKMPKVFNPVPGEAQKNHKTFYQVFVGPDTAFTGKPPNKGPRIPASFPDGTANTYLIVEAGEAVPWTAPLDVPYDAGKPVPKLGGLFPDGFHVATADGSVRFYKKGKPSERTLRLAITPADGQVLGPDF